MYAFDTEDKFAAAGPAATALLNYRESEPSISAISWAYERGTVSSNGVTRAWAEFSDLSGRSSLKRQKLSLIASADKFGGWTVSHMITRIA